MHFSIISLDKMIIVSDLKPFKWKICLIGEGAVGKTSLIKKYVFDQFDDTYSVTIGTKVIKKEIKIHHPKLDKEVDAYLLIWDLMGQQCFLDLLKMSYFFGAQGFIAMCDITRMDTLKELPHWVKTGLDITGEVPIVFLANKYDMVERQEVDFGELEKLTGRYENAVAYLSSVKTGMNVELAFKTLCEKMLARTLH